MSAKLYLVLTTTFMLSLGSPSFAEDTPEASNFSKTFTETTEAATREAACRDAFFAAEEAAFAEIEATFADREYIITLTDENEAIEETETGVSCTYSAIWSAQVRTTANELLGEEVSITGVYTGSCMVRPSDDACWQRIVRQAREDLRSQLRAEYDDIDTIDFRYHDFEGRQRDQIKGRSLESTADGTFYFDVVEAGTLVSRGSINVQRKDERRTEALAENPATRSQPSPAEKEDTLDIAIYYAWDVNNTGPSDELVLSADRFGLNLWAENRIGFGVFTGRDRTGIANEENRVTHNGGRYDTYGVGLGLRAFDSRTVTVEGMLYYVDAAPFVTTVAPNCEGCTSRVFEADNYWQTSLNLKTNNKGLNFGWMLTWKLLELENFDSFSGGFYLEAQF